MIRLCFLRIGLLFLLVSFPIVAFTQTVPATNDSLFKLIDFADSIYVKDPVLSFKLLNNVDSLNKNVLDSNLTAKCYITRAKLLINRNLFVNAQIQLSKAERYFNKNTPYLTYYNFYLNNALITDKNIDGKKVLSYYNRCLFYARKAKDERYIVNTYLNIADLSNIIGPENSLKYLDSAYTVAKTYANPKLLLRVKTTYAFYYVRSKNYVLAKSFIDSVDSLSANYQFKIDDKYNFGFTKAVVLGHFDLLKSISVLDSLEILCKKNNFTGKLPQVYTLKVINYKQLGDFENAFLNSEKLIDIKDSISKRNNIDLQLILKTQHESEIKQIELEQSARNNIYQRNLTAIVALFIIVFLVSIIILIRQYFHRYRLLAQQKIDQLNINRLALKSDSIRNQMSPHFILNALNSLQNLIFEKDKFKVSDAITNIGKLTSIYLQDNFNEFISVKKEMEQLQIYFEVEKLRIGDKVDLEFKIDPNINPDTCKIPALILQPLVENSIWHGVAPAQFKCTIIISFILIDNGLLIKVLDNGAGLDFKQGFNSRDRESKGLELIKNRLAIINQIYSTNITFSLDKNDSSQGAKAELFLPKIIS